jgi:capsular polysaccharide biosynthesis protein
MSQQHVESLASVLPQNFRTLSLPRRCWVKVDRMLLPSYVSDRGNGHLPREYYDFIRKNAFSKFGLPDKHIPTERIYVSRRHTKRRRITNEPALISLLERYGFRTITPESLSFREQVELFHRAEIIVAPHGSNWGNIIFSGAIKILVLYPDAVQETHIFTMAKALGQKHFFLAGNATDVNSDFSVVVAAVEDVLRQQMGLRPVASEKIG